MKPIPATNYVSSGLEAAQQDVDEGRLWKARDRVDGMLRTGCADQTVLDLAGRIHFAMGDLPKAGLHWFLTDLSGPDQTAAHDAVRERYGTNTVAFAEALPLRAPFDAYPDPTHARLSELQAAVKKTGRDWPAPRRIGQEPAPPSGRDKMTMSFLVVMTIGVWVTGVIAIVIFLVLWLAGGF